MNGPPTTSVARITSKSSPGLAFVWVTASPSLAGSAQARTPGRPPIWTSEFAHWPHAHSSPRGRWYLNERLNVRRPEANSAEAIVSPSKPAIALPSNVNVIGAPRSIRSPGWGSGASCRASGIAGGRGHALVAARGRGVRAPRSGSAVHSTTLVRVSRSARNQARQPERWNHHSRWTPATLRRK